MISPAWRSCNLALLLRGCSVALTVCYFLLGYRVHALWVGLPGGPHLIKSARHCASWAPIGRALQLSLHFYALAFFHRMGMPSCSYSYRGAGGPDVAAGCDGRLRTEH